MNLVVNNHNIIEIILITYLVSFFLIFVCKKLAVHINAIDIPRGRHIHKKPTPLMGGLAIYGAFLFGYMMYGTLTTQMLSILISSFLIVLVGVLDDIKPIRARYKLIVQITCACIVVFYGKLYFDEITFLGLNFTFLPIINQILSIFFIVAATNAINFLDGIDGLCAGISSIYFITISIIALAINKMQGLDVTLCLIMLGSTLGFLTHNFPPAKIFMGDGGSTFLGFMIAVIALLGFKIATITSIGIPMIILAIPIFDTAAAIIRRLIKHQSIGEPDKQHLHHQLLKMKFSTRGTILTIYAVDILFSIVSIFFVLGDNQLAMVIYVILMIILLYIVINTDILYDKKEKKK